MRTSVAMENSRKAGMAKPPKPPRNPPDLSMETTTSTVTGRAQEPEPIAFPARPTLPAYGGHSRSASLTYSMMNNCTPVAGRTPIAYHGYNTPYHHGRGTPIATPMQTPKSGWQRARPDIGEIVLECFDCGQYVGRAGQLLFFFLCFSIRHMLKALPADCDFTKRKQILKIKKGGLVTPQWPVCYHNNLALIEVGAILRYFSKKVGLYGLNVERDYQGDMLMDKLAYWRDNLSTLIGEHVDQMSKTSTDSPDVDEYLNSSRRQFLSQFELFLEAADTTFFLGEQMSWVDPPIMAVLYEDSTFVWQVMADRLEQHKDVTPTETGRDEAGAGNVESYEALREAAHVHMNVLDDYPKCTAFMDSVKSACPLLSKWILEHRNIWCSQEGEIVLEEIQPPQPPTMLPNPPAYPSGPQYGRPTHMYTQPNYQPHSRQMTPVACWSQSPAGSWHGREEQEQQLYTQSKMWSTMSSSSRYGANSAIWDP